MEITIKPTRNHIIVENIVKPMSTTIVLTEESKKQHYEEQMANWDGTCNVVAVGPAVESIKVGDRVVLKAVRLSSGQSVETGKYLLFTEGDIVATY